MKCKDPVLCYTSENKRIIRNFSYVKDSLLLPKFKLLSDCGKCLHCRKKKSRELAMKCVLHASLYKENCFLTLTYDETKEGYHNNFEYTDIQKFKKRLRQKVWRDYKKRIEVFNVHEYGKNGKKHWHLIVFGFQFPDRTLHTKSAGNPLYISKVLSSLWRYGFSTIGDVSEASAMYQSQYTQKDIRNGNTHANGKKSDSKHSGIGKPYFLKHYHQILTLGYVPFQGQKVPIPRSFEKIADKHWSHFYDQSKFFDNKERKAPYRPFKIGEENKEIADLYAQYKIRKQEKVELLTKEWDDVISHYITTKEKPDFVKSGENALYDFLNRQTQERF